MLLCTARTQQSAGSVRSAVSATAESGAAADLLRERCSSPPLPLPALRVVKIKS